MLLAAVAVVLGIVYDDQVWDWRRLRNYTPSSPVISLADNTTMTPQARRLFYAYYPELDSKSTFITNCPSKEQTIVLGCYVSRQAIYILKVSDSRLSGIQEVTAAHELLHAAYNRLSMSEKERVNKLLDDAFAELKNKRIQSLVDLYNKQDSSIVHNEMHSILATEASELPPDLETYYKRYFSDRKKIVAYSEKYEKVFVTIKSKLDDLERSLAAQKAEIDSLEATLNSQLKDLESKQGVLQSYKNAGDSKAYNSAVDKYNAQVRTYNADVASYKQKISTYNSDVATYNTLAADQRSLIKSIDAKIQDK